MYRLLITITRNNAATSQIVGFTTRLEADTVYEQLVKQDKTFARHSMLVSRLYVIG